MSKLMPRKVARVLLLEPQLWKALALLVSGRARRRRAGTFSYWHAMMGLMLIVSIWSAVEFVGVTTLVGLLWGDHWWAWLIIGLHAYGFIWLMGLFASFVTVPHRIEGDEFVFADGCLLEGSVKLDDIAAAERVKEVSPGFGGRSGLVLKDGGHSALIAFGPQVSVRLTLKPGARVDWRGREVGAGVRSVALSADDPEALLNALVGHVGGGG
ncbi:MAG: hypothetical protein ACYDH5_14200 [Acidimicrobiales bacterium]